MQQPQSPHSPGLNLADIYHVLFRHKKKILFVWLAGAAAAAALWFSAPVLYTSRAKLLVKYIVESTRLNPVEGSGSTVTTPDSRGEGVIAAELEILKSYDLALDVAKVVTPEKILASVGGGDDIHSAAGIVSSGLKVDAGRGSSVITVTFQNPDRNLVKPVLDQVIKSYTKMNFEAHVKSGALDDFLDQQTLEAKNQLAITERDLRKAKEDADVLSLPDTRKNQADTMARIQSNIYADQAELAGSIARLTLMTNRLSMAAQSNTNAPSAPAPPKDVQERYKRACALLEIYEKQERDLESQFLPDSPRLRGLHDTIVSTRLTKEELESTYPELQRYRVNESINRGQSEFSGTDLVGEMARIRSLEARIKLHNQKFAQVREEAKKLDEAEGNILELQRKRDLLEQKYNYFSSRQDRNRFDELLGPGRISSIKDIEAPTPPYKDIGKLSKKLLMLLVACFGGGIALAFFVEFYLDRSVKRPIEIEAKTGLPLFLSIPKARLNGSARLKGIQHPTRLLTTGNGQEKNGSSPENANGKSSALVPRGQDHLQPFFEALRDRLIMSFEMRNLVHKPKLVAVTSCGFGAGVSTVASGLAASLSETGDGNVLLVDMNEVGQGAAHYFHKGELQCLDDALELEKRESAMVQENLYVVSEKPAAGLPRVLHKRFSSLLPRLKASDYDYIIFDMPPVSQISPTHKLARFMDMVFMVVEAEKTSHDAIQRATDLLDESKAHVGVILNKSRNYVPKRLQ